jgi:osmotically-inducible protein OsmY
MNKLMLSILAVFSTAVLHGAGADMQSRDFGRPGTAQATQETANADQKLEKDVKYKISSGLFTKGFDQVNVSARNGQITLDGFVSSADEKSKVEKEVRDIDGVKSVVSNVRIQEKDSLKAERPADLPKDGTFKPMNR